MAFTMCDGSDYVTAYFLSFIELLTVKENVLYMALNAIKCIKRIKYMVVAQILKNHLSFLKQFSYE